MKEELVGNFMRLPIAAIVVLASILDDGLSIDAGGSYATCVVLGTCQPFFIITLQCIVNECPLNRRLIATIAPTMVIAFATLYSLLIYFSVIQLTPSALATYIFFSDMWQLVVYLAVNAEKICGVE